LALVDASNAVVGADRNTQLIDTDVHELMRSFDDLVPYLAPEWHRFAFDYAWPTRGAVFNTAFPYPFPILNPNSDSAARADWVSEGSEPGDDLDAMRQHLFVEEKVSLAILNGFYHASAVEGCYEFAAGLASAYNSYQVEHWLEKDDRLRGSVHVVAHLPEIAAREIDRVAEHPQIVQVFLPLVTNRSYGERQYRPIFEAAARNNLAVCMHHGPATKVGNGYPSHWMEWHMLAPPQAAQLQLTSMICNGVFDQFPDLTVMILETGVAWLPWYLWRMDEHYRYARADIPWVRRLPSEHMRDNVLIATQPLADLTERQFMSLIELSASERIFCFATDYPHYDADTADKVLTRRMPQDLWERIRFRNVAEKIPRLRGLLP
jgi:uncharacterized protein